MTKGFRCRVSGVSPTAGLNSSRQVENENLVSVLLVGAVFNRDFLGLAAIIYEV